MKNSKHSLSMMLLVVVTIIWGSGFVATEYALNAGLDPSVIMAIRFMVGSLLVGICFFKTILQSSKRTIVHGVFAGVILFLAFYSQTVGQPMTTVSNTAFITATNVVMIPFILWIITKKAPKSTVFLLCGLSLCGVAILTMNSGEHMQFTSGDLLVLLCAFLYALHIVFLGKYCNRDHPTAITFWQLLTSGLLSTVALLFVRPEISIEQMQAGLLPVLYLGVFSTCICYYLQTYAQQHLPPSQAGVIMSLEGVFGALFSIAFGLEIFSLNMLLGGYIVTACIILMEKINRINATDKV